jgi:S1-C subfamily serine protease
MSSLGTRLAFVWISVPLLCLGCGQTRVSARNPSLGTAAPQVCTASERTPTPATIESKLRPNIVQVQGDAGIVGSGFLIPSSSPNDILIVTNYHVVVESDSLQLVFVRSNNEHVPISGVSVVSASPEHDLVLLKAPRLAAMGQGLKFSHQVAAGQSVVSLGYPHIDGVRRAEPVLSSGLLTQTDIAFGERHFVQTDMNIAPGNSGGPAVDTCGRVIGVVAAKHAKLAHVGLLISAERVLDLQKRYATATAPTSRDVESRINAFVQAIQRDDGQDASAYFTRSFLQRNVRPILKEGYTGVLSKIKRWEEFQDYLRRRGYKTEDLTEEQLAVVQSELNLYLTPEELHAYKTIQRSKEEDLDFYAMLQAYLGPLLNYLFGRIDTVEVQNVRAKGEGYVAHVVFNGPTGRAHYEIALATDLGQLQIDDVRAVNRQQPATQPVDRREAAAERETRWFDVARARRE